MKNFIRHPFCYRVLCFISRILGVSCNEENPVFAVPTNPSVVNEIDGFVFVKAGGNSTFLGTDVNGARTSETPRMKVHFTYNFYISKNEVTRGEYNALRNGAGVECHEACDDQSPVTNVSYFDAVLYANAKSKAYNLDTVYTYTKATFNPKGGCDDLDGLVFREDVNGFRLPTEAEWVYAASHGWNPEAGWHSENSGFVAHDVATSPANTLGIYDMAGNVLEWVNDWLTYFRQEPVTNFVGGADGGGLGERVVKGGSYRNDPSLINIYSRGDIYTVVSSAKADYIGFRLALGAIPNATMLDERGSVKESVVNSLAETNDVKHLTGTYESKLVFRNDVTGNLAFIEYGTGFNSVTEIKDSLQVYHPDVSPDGKRVAFCTGIEGGVRPSSVYVRNLDATGSGLVKLDVENAVIPRWRILENGDTAIVYVSSAADNSDDASFAAMSTWQVPFNNGQFGIPKKIFDGAFHGGVSADKQLAVTGSKLLRAKMATISSVVFNGVDSIWYGGEQACNVSLANDGSNRTLFLDFGGATGAQFVGQSYNTHERLLVMNNRGELVQSVAAPAGYTFDHTEWAIGGSNLAVATLANVNGVHQKIVLVDFSDGSVKTLVEGDELWHPCLWHSRNRFDSVNLDTDSAGVYYHPSASYGAIDLRVKMERFWEYRDELTAVALGSSRTMFALYDKDVKSQRILNMAFSSGQVTGMEYLFENYVLNHVKNLKVVVLEMSPAMLWTDRYDTWSEVIYNRVPGYKYDESHGFWVDGLPDHFLDAVKASPRPKPAMLFDYDLEDFLMPSRNWGEAVCVRDSNVLTLDSPLLKRNLKTFEDMVQKARARGITVIVTVLPQNPGYAKTGTFGIYGPRRSYAMEIINEIGKLDVIMFDENKFGEHDYTSEMAYNTDHLSALGAKRYTHRLDSLLATLEN